MESLPEVHDALDIEKVPVGPVTDCSALCALDHTGGIVEVKCRPEDPTENKSVGHSECKNYFGELPILNSSLHSYPG